MGPSSPFVDLLLAVPATGYHAVQKTREQAYRRGLLRATASPVPVISVGNLLMGGSGKTPFVIYLATALLQRGRKPAVVSRGYRGSHRGPHLVVGDGSSARPLAQPAVAGDEPFLMARRLPRVPVVIGRRRIHPAREAVRLFHCDVIILDDGFQHLPLQRDADIVLLTGQEDRMFPRGRLREPFSALGRAHLVVLAGDSSTVPSPAVRYLPDRPVFRCSERALSLETVDRDARPEEYADREVVLASGIANPERFRQTAQRLGWRVADHLVFPDHHRFTAPSLGQGDRPRGSLEDRNDAGSGRGVLERAGRSHQADGSILKGPAERALPMELPSEH
ncbi:MAG: tetraacyldisaccharide 4'-kinase [Deltaproteobacteria bacterium]